jgi:protocatechuate 4,5-dioxygenase alpha chain
VTSTGAQEARDAAGGGPPPRTLTFDGPLAEHGYRLNRFGWSMTRPENRERYHADPTGYMGAMGLTPGQIARIEARDWTALLAEGASIYILAKLAIVRGGDLMEIAAQMRGQTPQPAP